jgi:hypothetical protein
MNLTISTGFQYFLINQLAIIAVPIAINVTMQIRNTVPNEDKPNIMVEHSILFPYRGANSCCSLMLSKNSFLVAGSVLNEPLSTVV